MDIIIPKKTRKYSTTKQAFIIGTNIVYLRSRLKLTRKQLSEILDIKYTTLSNYENGYREPNATTLLLIARYFKVSVDILLTP